MMKKGVVVEGHAFVRGDLHWHCVDAEKPPSLD
jgi:hypothetical protein